MSIARSDALNYWDRSTTRLTYQPHGGNEDGKFRQIHVTLRDPNLRAVTKTGYYAPDKSARISSRQQTMINLSEAARSTIPLSGI